MPSLSARRTLKFDVDAGGRVPWQAGRTQSGDPNHDAEWTVFTFTVTGFRPTDEIIDVNINIDMVHSWVEDLEIRLRRAPGTMGATIRPVSWQPTRRPLR
jgi:hypothetical protein